MEFGKKMRSNLNKIAKAINSGALVIYPTETAYALGCNILDELALNKIYELKKRNKKKYLTCIVSNLDMASEYCYLNEKEIEICKKYMPGPLTLVAKKKKIVPDLLNNDFVFRISSNKIATELCEKANVPIVSTSANISGEKEAYSIKEIPKEIRDKVDFIIDIGELPKRKPSTIITLRPKFKILRKGEIIF